MMQTGSRTSTELSWINCTQKCPKMQDFETWILCDKTVERKASPSATTAETNTMTQASVTPTTGILFSSILDKLQLFDQG